MLCAAKKNVLPLRPNEHSIGSAAMDHISDKKKAIFESMLALVKENGFHGTPMSMVARKAGVAAGTIYHYFESKEQLISELSCLVRKQMTAAIENGADESLPFQDRFFRIWMNLYRFYENNPDALWFFEQFVNSPYNTEKEKEGHDEFHDLIFRFFRKGVDEGFFRKVNPEILGILAHGNIITTAKMQRYGKIAIGEAELQQIAQMLWMGLADHHT